MKTVHSTLSGLVYWYSAFHKTHHLKAALQIGLLQYIVIWIIILIENDPFHGTRFWSYCSVRVRQKKVLEKGFLISLVLFLVP